MYSRGESFPSLAAEQELFLRCLQVDNVPKTGWLFGEKVRLEIFAVRHRKPRSRDPTRVAKHFKAWPRRLEQSLEPMLRDISGIEEVLDCDQRCFDVIEIHAGQDTARLIDAIVAQPQGTGERPFTSTSRQFAWR